MYLVGGTMGKKAETGIKKVDAVAMYSANPESMPNSLLQRERIIVSILAHHGMPMPAEWVRKIYLELVFDNIRRNLELIDTLMLLQRLVAFRDKENASKNEYDELYKTLTDFPEKYQFWSTYSKESHIKRLTELYRRYFPKQRKVPLLISGITVQSMLDNMSSFYSNFIETRPMLSGRKYYYLNPEFLKLWRKNEEKCAKTLTEADYGSESGEAEFYYMVNKLLADRAHRILPELAAIFPKNAKDVKSEIPDQGTKARGEADTSSSKLIKEIIPLDDSVAEFFRDIASKIDQIKLEELVAVLKEDRIG